MRFLHEADGKQSASRAVMIFVFGAVFAVWLGAVAWIVWASWGKEVGQVVNLWDATGLGDAMQWGLMALVPALVPYVTGKVAETRKDQP